MQCDSSYMRQALHRWVLLHHLTSLLLLPWETEQSSPDFFPLSMEVFWFCGNYKDQALNSHWG